MSTPNIIWIMADDMGYGDLSCYGATKIQTPTMDRVAAEGMRFADAHSCSAVCTPSRYGVMTGRYAWRSRLQSGVLWGHSRPLIERGRLTVASLLKRHGYATAAVGKWHLGLGWAIRDDARDQFPDDLTTVRWIEEVGEKLDYSKPITDGPTTRGFDSFFGIAGSLDMRPYCFIEDDHTVGVPDRPKAPVNPQQRKGFMVEGWDDEAVDLTFAAKACGWMQKHHAESPGQPFFLYLTPSAPHRPCVPPPEFRGASQAGLRGDMVVVVDHVVGQVLGTLDRLGLADDTLVIFTSDNGARPCDVDGETHGHKSCGDWRGFKADIWDGGHREPFIARWPGRIRPGSVCGQTACLTDLMATVADILGAGLPDGAAPDSVSLLPLLLGGAEPVRDAIVHHSVDGMFSVRQGPWKLILGLGSGGFSQPRREDPVPNGPEGQLYHMVDDPAETANLWLDRPDIVERLTALLGLCQDGGRSVS